jgi:hypothetical protein
MNKQKVDIENIMHELEILQIKVDNILAKLEGLEH